MITELLCSRFSVREFQDRPIPDHILHTMLEAGRLSPSGGNEQSWVFGVITDPHLIAQIADIAHKQKWIAQAPLVIALCTIMVDDARGGRDIQCDRFPEYAAVLRQIDREIYWALNQEEHQTKIAGAHIALAALENGIGSCWVSRFEVKRLAMLLNLPQGYMPSELLALGYPARELSPRPKKRLNEVVFHNTYQA